MFFAGAIQLLYTVSFLVVDESDAFFDHVTPFETANNFARLLFPLAIFLLGSPEPNALKPRRALSFRRMLRIVALFSFSLIIFRDISISDPPLPQLWEMPLADIADALSTLFVFIYLFLIARRSGVRSLLRQARIALIVVPLCACLTMAVNYFTSALEPETHFADPIAWILVAAAVYQLYIFFRFRRTLRQSAAFARQYWHFCSPIPPAPSA
jgi:hypothetical protein